jgi:uncharacterized membrane protein
MPQWRKSTWVLVGLIALWVAVFIAWFVVPDTGTDEAARMTALAVHFAIWAIGLAFSIVIWGAYRSLTERS